MAQTGDLLPAFHKMISLLKSIERNTLCTQCSETVLTPSAGTGGTIEEGARYLRVTKTNDTGTVVITFPDESTVTLTGDGEVFEIPQGGKLTEISISSEDGGTWTWIILA